MVTIVNAISTASLLLFAKWSYMNMQNSPCISNTDSTNTETKPRSKNVHFSNETLRLYHSQMIPEL
jgi:hypothetical protein